MDRRPDKEIIDDQIKHYLTRVAGHLYGANPQAVEGTLEEIRQHLYTSSEELVHNGICADQAVQRAIQRFGSSNKIGASLARQLPLYGFPIGVYRALWACHCAMYAGYVLGVLQMIGWNVCAAVIIVISMCIAAVIVRAPQRFKAQSKSSASLSGRIARIVRELQREHIETTVNLSGTRRRLYLFNLTAMSIVSIHEHAYGFLGVSTAVIVAFVLIRRTASRLGANVSA
ncbi:MAG: hypothetical protein ABIY70_05595 [Capsulimonas sp.]|uniref:hypothetical protein n=1 Tax=Capsulimonas sp. TaxID=2494211 RepID=UPI003265F703